MRKVALEEVLERGTQPWCIEVEAMQRFLLVDILTAWAAGATEADIADVTRNSVGIEGGQPLPSCCELIFGRVAAPFGGVASERLGWPSEALHGTEAHIPEHITCG